MSLMAEIDLNFLAKQLDRVLTDTRQLRDDMTVLTGIVIRLDGSMNGVIQEMRGIRDQIAHMNRRIEKLEEAK